MGIIDTMLGRREPVAAYRTVDGGHPAPYPDMTDEQLYNYELAFDVPHKTFDKPPASASATAPTRPVAQSRTRATTETTEATEATVPRQATVPGEAREAREARESESREARGFIGRQRPHVPYPPKEDNKAHVNVMKASGMMPLDLTKPVRTITTKQSVEIITTRARHPVYKVHGYIGDDEVLTVFTLDGRLSENGPRFLENVPEKQQLHVNIYPNRDVHSKEKFLLTQHDTQEQADAAATTERIACVRLEFDL